MGCECSVETSDSTSCTFDLRIEAGVKFGAGVLMFDAGVFHLDAGDVIPGASVFIPGAGVFMPGAVVLRQVSEVIFLV